MSFNALPVELQLRIITESIQQGQPLASSSAARQETKQALALALVSRSCYTIVAGWLYRNVRATTPSALRQLHATLSSRPDLCALVKSLHLGPDADLPNLGWPLKMMTVPDDRHQEFHLMPSLPTDRHRHHLPAWYGPGSAFRLKGTRGETCEDFSIFNALRAAMKDLDVDPEKMRYSQSGRAIGLRSWCARIFLLKAALDLYLMEVQRVYDERGGVVPKSWWIFQRTPTACRTSTCGHYPSLGVLHVPITSATALRYPNTRLVTVSQLWQYLEEPGGPIDHFDSVVLLTRSTRSGLNLTERDWPAVFLQLGGPHADRYDYEWREAMEKDGGEDYTPQALPLDGEELEGASGPTTAGPSHKVEDLLDLARSVLELTAQVSNLSLTSYLHRALPAVPSPLSLRSLSIGPYSSWSFPVFRSLGMERLKNMLRLRIVGRISDNDANVLCHELPALKELEWVCYVASSPK